MNDTIEVLVERIRGGTQEDMKFLWDALHGQVWQQARHWARIFRKHRPDVTAEDLYQSGYLALDRAVRDYAPDGGIPFCSWFFINLRLEFAQTAGYRSARILEALEAEKAPGPWSFPVEQALKRLPADVFALLYLRYGLGISSEEAGHLLEAPAETVAARETAGLNMLRELLSSG